jgi:hypothetical protein
MKLPSRKAAIVASLVVAGVLYAWVLGLCRLDPCFLSRWSTSPTAPKDASDGPLRQYRVDPLVPEVRISGKEPITFSNWRKDKHQNVLTGDVRIKEDTVNKIDGSLRYFAQPWSKVRRPNRDQSVRLHLGVVALSDIKRGEVGTVDIILYDHVDDVDIIDIKRE